MRRRRLGNSSLLVFLVYCINLGANPRTHPVCESQRHTQSIHKKPPSQRPDQPRTPRDLLKRAQTHTPRSRRRAASKAASKHRAAPQRRRRREAMTAVTGANLRGGEAYWELSGPTPINRTVTCRACKKTIMRASPSWCATGGSSASTITHECFSGDADPRTQQNSSFSSRSDYHAKTAPKLSSLEGPGCTDADGRKLGRVLTKDKAPASVGVGKWNSGASRRQSRIPPARPTRLTVPTCRARRAGDGRMITTND